MSKEGQIVNRVDSQVLMTSDELEIFEEASMIMILIAGENPTELNSWFDNVTIRATIDSQPC